MKVENVVLNKHLHSRQNLNKKFVDTIFRGEKRKQNQKNIHRPSKRNGASMYVKESKYRLLPD